MSSLYCPQCGLRHLISSRNCSSCGEDMGGGLNYLKKSNHFENVFFIVMSLACILFFTKNLFYSELVVLSLIPLGLYFFYCSISDETSTSKPIYNRYCPKCQNSNFNRNYCIKCGYNLKDILGYVKTYRYDIEMNINFINIYQKIYLEHNDGWPSILSPKTFKLDKIENLSLSSCKKIISHKPCLTFDYLGRKCKNPLARKYGDKCVVTVDLDNRTVNELKRILSRDVYQKSIKQVASED